LKSSRRAAAVLLLIPVLAHAAQAPAESAPGEPAADAAPPAAAEPRFDILEFRILGNRSLAQDALERAVYPFLGPDRSIADAELARGALEQAYRSAGRGTVYVDIPEQDVDAGIVRLVVTEGTLRRVSVEGATYFSARKIRKALPAAAVGAAPDLPELQREIGALNLRTRDLSLVPVLAAGPVPGTVDLTLKVSDELPLHGSAELNDQFTADTSRLRLNASVSYDNLFDRLDSLALQYQTAPSEPREADVLVASYTRALSQDRRFSLFYVDSNSDVAALGTLSVLGKGSITGARLFLPLTNTAAATHTLILGADYKDFLESILIEADQSLNTPISYLNLSLGTSSTWRWGSDQLGLTATANFGPRRLGNGAQEFADKRFRGRPNYFYLRSAGVLRTSLPAGFTLQSSLSGQFAVEPLIGNEQFALGGASSVRGYLEAEELGDLGLRGSIELQSPTWTMRELRATALVFFDAGIVSTLAPLPGEVRRSDLSSVGVGTEMTLSRWLSASLAWAYPLVQAPRTAAGDSRLHFSLRTSW
jgi:hemolysin activation/secretion protein